MIKKSVAILLILQLIICTTCVTIFIDYCPMKEKVTCSLTNEQSCCCGKSKKSNCCNENKITLKKIEDSFVSSQCTNLNQQAILVIIPIPTFNLNSLYTNYTINFRYNINPPELPVSLSILHRSILI